MTRAIVLKRIITGEHGTFGVLIEGEEAFALVLENEWKDNETDVSCIPAGGYVCKRVSSPKFGDTFEVTNVKDRTHIILHWGNLTKDTLGCPLLAEEFGTINGRPGVRSSRRAFAEFMERMKGVEQFMLFVRWTT